MTTKTKFVFVLHNHQPIGNFDVVFAKAYEKSYLPYLEVIERRESFRFGLHISGPLLEWLEANQPKYLDRIAELADAGRVEMLGGAFYEAIPIMLADRDRKAQFEMMNEYIERRFGKRPTGLWLAERVWEQSVAHDIASCGLKYTLLDDHHFKLAGIPASRLNGYFYAEDRGSSIAVFPICEKLRYMIPFAQPEETIAYLEKHKNSGAVLCYGDDGEKFGLWPHTYRPVFVDGWLNKFLDALEKNSGLFEMCLPREVLQSCPPVGAACIPDSSYREMTEWALPVPSHRELISLKKRLESVGAAENAAAFLKGGSWRGFRARYPESANMSALQAEVSALIARAEDADVEPERIAEARRSLLKAQCDCAYWHGVFGGLYLPHLRDAVYDGLIAAQAVLASQNQIPSVEKGDFDTDLCEDIRLNSGEFIAYIKPSKGGMLRALNILACRVNLANTLARHLEEYHDRVATATVETGDPDAPAESIHNTVKAKEANLDKYLVYDWHDRALFQEHFLQNSVTIESFKMNRYYDEGDFTVEPYEIVSTTKHKVKLHRFGSIWRNGKKYPLDITKEYAVSGSKLTVSYSVNNRSDEKLSLRMGVESNFGMSAGDAYTHNYFGAEGLLGRFKLAASLLNRDKVALRDDWRKFEVSLGWTSKTEMWLYPIYTISQSEGGFERVFQCAAVMPLFAFTLNAGDAHKFSITLEVRTW